MIFNTNEIYIGKVWLWPSLLQRAGLHRTGADTQQCGADVARRTRKRKLQKKKEFCREIVPRPGWNTTKPYCELFYILMELVKKSSIWMLWKIFYCQMKCKISDFRVILSGLTRHGQELPNCSTKADISSHSFLPNIFLSLQHDIVCWDIWPHHGKVMEAQCFRNPASKEAASFRTRGAECGMPCRPQLC